MTGNTITSAVIIGAGIFGGDGFMLQRLSGPCTAWVELGGEVVTYDLAPGETLKVHPGHIGMFQDSVNFDITLEKNGDLADSGKTGLVGKVWAAAALPAQKTCETLWKGIQEQGLRADLASRRSGDARPHASLNDGHL